MEGSGKSVEVRMIGVGRLVGHPLNSNVMVKGVRGKLRRQIEGTGRYEPLVVRKHPVRGAEGYFELINGHHRKLVLEELGYTEVACVVWELTDAETLMLLATVNRLSGKEHGGRRLALLEALGEAWEAEAGVVVGVRADAEGMVKELAGLLPEDEGALRKVLSEEAVVAEVAVGEMEEAFTVFLKREEKARLVAALRGTDGDLGVALMKWVGGRG